MLYLELLKEEERIDPTSPTGTAIHIITSGKCAVIDEKTLDKIIVNAWKRYKDLKKLKKDATHHTHLTTEDEIKKLNVPYEIKTLVKKQC
jgi:hypothetical protein